MVERDPVRVTCVAQEHNATSPARAESESESPTGLLVLCQNNLDTRRFYRQIQLEIEIKAMLTLFVGITNAQSGNGCDAAFSQK